MIKRSKTNKEYKTRYDGYDIVLPAGTEVTNQTALGPDDNYRFVVNTSKLAKEVSGLSHSILEHDLKYRGLNVPEEYCDPYQEKP
jgi:hypothetical protein